ncbi:MAG TPA: MaoC family dehydratase [Chloroflexota bacterium]|nr:MaoC family dehydratase [Chloroflexota bacterium]
METRTITSIDELKELVNQETALGEWVEVTQDMVNAFADATGDHQWIHVDVERAKGSPFGGTIAHGYLTLSMSPLLMRGRQGIQMKIPSRMGLNYGLNRVRFPAPVKVGKRVRMRTKLLSVEEVAPKVYQMINQQTVEIEGEEKPGMVAEHITRTYLE